ncbi:MAG: TIGR01906 family membrane protein [Clostridiales bacterium]|nr:TIGR01906 family membrane protein [Clostridiales bacterium]
MKQLKYAFIGLLFFIFILITVVEFYTFNHEYYIAEFEKYNVYENTDLDIEGVSFASSGIISYLKDDRSDLNITYNQVAVFNEKEISHMVDVKKIFIFLKYFKNLSILLGILLLVLDKKLRTVFWSMLYSGMHSIVITGLLGILIINDFTSAFIGFHKMFFDNDLWLLNPNTDRLIQILPEGFFLDMAMVIVITHLSITLSLSAIALYNLRKS